MFNMSDSQQDDVPEGLEELFAALRQPRTGKPTFKVPPDFDLDQYPDELRAARSGSPDALHKLFAECIQMNPKQCDGCGAKARCASWQMAMPDWQPNEADAAPDFLSELLGVASAQMMMLGPNGLQTMGMPGSNNGSSLAELMAANMQPGDDLQSRFNEQTLRNPLYLEVKAALEDDSVTEMSEAAKDHIHHLDMEINIGKTRCCAEPDCPEGQLYDLRIVQRTRINYVVPFEVLEVNIYTLGGPVQNDHHIYLRSDGYPKWLTDEVSEAGADAYEYEGLMVLYTGTPPDTDIAVQ